MSNSNLIHVNHICNFLLKQYPLSLQEKWDYSGYVNKPKINCRINDVYICLDINKYVVDSAIKNRVKLIVSHHPIFIDKNDLLSCQKYIINKIKKHHIFILTLHTCFDNAKNGMNFLIAKILQLRNIKWFDNKKRFVIGNFPHYLTTRQIINLFKTKFSLNIFLSNKINKKFKTLAICAGAGINNFKYAFNKLKNKNLLIITGDVKYHNWQDLDFYKLACLDVGHNIENCFVDFIANLLEASFDKLCIHKIKTQEKVQLIN